MDVTLALLCDAANTTAEGKLNILGTFDRIGAKSFPVSHPAMSLVLRLGATPAESGDSRELEIRVVGPDGENVGKSRARSTLSRRTYLVPTLDIN